MMKYISIAFMMGLIGLPTQGISHPIEAQEDQQRAEAGQMIAPIAALKDLPPNHDDLIPLELAVYVSLQTEENRAKTEFACRSLADWGEDLALNHYVLAFLSFQGYWRESCALDGTPDEGKADNIAQWTSRFIRPDYGEEAFLAIAKLVKEAILALDALPEDNIQAAADSLFADLNTAWGLQTSLNNPDAADWQEASVVATLRDFLTDDE
ncbi:hypothetical protein OAN21_02020 [Alphaproteobacteria bacterium]|nr:hypothetical protein [Alphaproteobacteria bacterium]